ncbi:hypothetical protein [Nonomuraea recticatena]|uniref:hypothetical protein n=1 Tax=Nonomuraea recticatena TaxID=46178 RepID=UPI003615A1AC
MHLRRSPEADRALPLLMEHTAVALNPRHGMLAAEQAARPLLRQFARHLAEQEGALYEVRRAFRAKKGKPTKMGNAVRSLVRVADGGRTEALDELSRRARALEATVERDGPHRRAWTHRRNRYFPCVEEILTIGPALTSDKVGPGFAKAWEKGLRGPRQLDFLTAAPQACPPADPPRPDPASTSAGSHHAPASSMPDAPVPCR